MGFSVHNLTAFFIFATSCIFLCFHVAGDQNTSTTHSTTVETTTTKSPTTKVLETTAKTQAVLTSISNQTPKCTKNQIKYVYTECDINNGRWKVGVPIKPNTCMLDHPPQPERGTDCSFSCPEGKYLNIETQKCTKCKSGTFSLSGGIRFRSWKNIPSGFVSWGTNDDDEHLKNGKNKCQGKAWTPKGDYIESAGDYCKSVLAYSVTLEKAGNVSIVYRADDDSAFFHVKISNNFCTTSADGKHNFYLNPEMRWKRTYIPLKRGRNVIRIEAAYFEEDGSSHWGDGYDSEGSGEAKGSGLKQDISKSVQIREIKITGLAYTSECSTCPAGTYSGDGASFCKNCDENTFSKDGADSCIRCGNDEYSGRGSASCTKRPKCSEKDFYEMWSDCDSNGKTRKTFFWVIPKICANGAAIPPAGTEIDCPPCNPGQFRNGTSCSFCLPDEYSDGQNGCKKCPPSTAPDIGIYMRWWQHVPRDLFEFYCISKIDRSCKSSNGWRQFYTFIDTGIGHADDTEVGFKLVVPAFRRPVSTVTVEYEVICTSFCVFIIEAHTLLSGKRILQKGRGSQKKTKRQHHIHEQGEVVFRIRFLKGDKSPEDPYEFPDDRLKLYAFNVTNAINGGADKCSACPLGVGKGAGCIQCEKGSFLENKRCRKCRKGTYLEEKNPSQAASCKPCPKGSSSVEGSTHCFSNCQLKSDDGHEFDFTDLSGPMLWKSGKMFTSHGFPFYRLFNVTVCGGTDTVSHCVNNVTKGEDDGKKKAGKIGIKAMICRSTLIPSHEKKDNIIAQSMSLGDYLEEITFGDLFKHSFVGNDTKDKVKTRTHRTRRDFLDSFKDEMKLNDTLPSDINFFFKSSPSSSRCSGGYSTVVTLRCDPGTRDKGYIRTSPACLTGTCDGCVYHLFWHSKYACPLCTYADYQNITSACDKGKITTHYVWNYPKICRDGVVLPPSTSRGCSVFERTVLDLKVFVAVFLGMGILLVFLIVLLCYRNRKLTYKYSRLVDEAHYKDGELPASEKCTLDEGEEEEDIILSRGPGGNGRRILDRLKKLGSPKNRDDFSEFETINLTERTRKDSSADEL